MLTANHQQPTRVKLIVSILSIIVSILAIGLTGLKSPVLAERMESSSYVIQFGNFNMGSGEQNSASYNLTYTTGQVAAGPYGQYGSSGYFVGSGFQYIYQIRDFTFAVDKLDIDLGLLTPNAHNTDTNTLTVNTRSGGYVIYAYEKGPLALIDDSTITIPDTTCDDGNCDETQASSWTNPAVGGFGFNISGDDVASDFINANYFRQFADRSSSEPMQPIMSSTNLAIHRTATVTYKAGLTREDQAAGNYVTHVAYVAVPTY